MPYEIKSEDEGRVSKTRYYGVLTGDEILSSYRDRYADAQKLKKLRIVIADYSDVSKVDLDSLDVSRLAQIALEAARLNPDILLVAIMPDDLVYGLGRMWQGQTSQIGWKTCIARTQEEAEQWLAQQSPQQGKDGAEGNLAG